jgi:hypothetical protein
MNIRQIKDYYNNKPVEYIIKENYELVEDKEYTSRFSLKNIKEISNIPINKPIKYSSDIIIKAIKYGMIFVINYKGAEDDHFAGHERAVEFLVMGRSSKGKILIRAWHLNGWSVSHKRHVDKIWRLFRADRILSMTFTGNFYRLPPSGYNMNDKAMVGGIISRAQFSEIRRNQQVLVNKNKIQNREDITLGDEKRKSVVIKVKKTDTVLDLKNPTENAYVNNIKDISITKLSFLKTLYGNKYIAIIGALGNPGNVVKVIDDSGKNIGVYKCLDSITGDILKSIKNVKGNNVFDLYVFDKKI